MAPKSNLYVSVTRSKPSGGEGYHRPLHKWLISIEPHHSYHIPGAPHKDADPIHYGAIKNDGVYTFGTHPSTAEPAIIGNILIAENARISAEELHKILEDELGAQSKRADGERRRSDEEGEAEEWVRIALRSLQTRKIIDDFDLEEFMTFVHGYEVNRMEGEGKSLIAYPKAHKDHESKGSKHKFWISRPGADRVKRNDRGEAAVYGGLM